MNFLSLGCIFRAAVLYLWKIVGELSLTLLPPSLDRIVLPAGLQCEGWGVCSAAALPKPGGRGGEHAGQCVVWSPAFSMFPLFLWGYLWLIMCVKCGTLKGGTPWWLFCRESLWSWVVAFIPRGFVLFLTFLYISYLCPLENASLENEECY